ncbi:MAG: carboxypeptidase regulatory-like domain-containing protein [Acidobacteriota bacterium]
MAKKTWIPAVLLAVIMLGAPGLEAQAWRGGRGRLDGTVVDQNGNPVVDAVVQLRLKGEGTDLKTDKSGKWAVLGINGGAWSIDVSAPGFQTFKTTVQVSEVLRVPMMKIQMVAAVKQEATEASITVGGRKISPETAAAIEKGNVAMRAADELSKAYDACRSAPKPGEDSPEAQEACSKSAQSSRSAKLIEAQEAFGLALKDLPDNGSILTNLELAYYLNGNLDEASKYARQIVAQNPADAPSWMMIAKVELERGHFDAGKEALSHVPEEKLTDPIPFLNMGILYYNKKRSADAEESFTKAIARRADLSEAYYYRGLARMQGKNNAGAKADFQKYMQMDPKGKDADTVKDILKTIK